MEKVIRADKVTFEQLQDSLLTKATTTCDQDESQNLLSVLDDEYDYPRYMVGPHGISTQREGRLTSPCSVSFRATAPRLYRFWERSPS